MKQADYPNGGVIPISDGVTLTMIFTDEAFDDERRNTSIIIEWPLAEPKPTVRHGVMHRDVFSDSQNPDCDMLVMSSILEGDIRFMSDLSVTAISALLQKKIREYLAAHPEVMVIASYDVGSVMVRSDKFIAMVTKLNETLGEWENIKNGPDRHWAIFQPHVYLAFSAEGVRKASKYHHWTNGRLAWAADVVEREIQPASYPALMVYSVLSEYDRRPQVTVIDVASVIALLPK